MSNKKDVTETARDDIGDELMDAVAEGYMRADPRGDGYIMVISGDGVEQLLIYQSTEDPANAGWGYRRSFRCRSEESGPVEDAEHARELVEAGIERMKSIPNNDV